MVGEKRNTLILVNLPVTKVQRGTRNKAKTLRLEHLQPPDVCAGSGTPGGARIIHQGADELLVEQNSVPDGEITPPVQERTQQAHPLSSSPAHLSDLRRPGKLFVQGHPQITNGIDTNV